MFCNEKGRTKILWLFLNNFSFLMNNLFQIKFIRLYNVRNVIIKKNGRTAAFHKLFFEENNIR